MMLLVVLQEDVTDVKQLLENKLEVVEVDDEVEFLELAGVIDIADVIEGNELVDIELFLEMLEYDCEQ